jgi:hypothetical protein
MTYTKKALATIPTRFFATRTIFCFNGIVADVTRYLAGKGVTEKIDFIFDTQPGQTDAVWASWAKLRDAAPPDVRALFNDYPIFRDDKTTLPLQAADLSVGWLRIQAVSRINGTELEEPIWAEKISPSSMHWTILVARNDAAISR